ncbi:MAG: hypothetical protein ACRD4Q_12655 [Candidatus Acidiferrales bacterium]
MFSNTKLYLGGLAILLLALPGWARPSRTDTAQWDILQSATIGNTQLKPGNYQLKAQETANTLDVVRDGKVVAQAPCHWIQLPKKAQDTEVVMNKNQVVQVQFEGKTEAIQLQ